MDEQTTLALFRQLKQALEANDLHRVNAVCFTLVEGKARLGQRWQTIARVLQTNGEYNAARTAMAFYVDAMSHAPLAVFEQAALLAQTGRLNEAWEAMQRVPPDVPDRAGHAYILGSIAINLGTVQAAQHHLQQALAANPLLGQALLSLAVSAKMDRANPLGDEIIAAEPRMESAPPLERAHFQYALGKVHFDRHQTDSAFRAFDTGAKLVAETRRYDAADDAHNASECCVGFTEGTISNLNKQVAVPSARPIFVTGLPRSGTTLVEQILVSHSGVVGGEELGQLPIVERGMGGREDQRLIDRLHASDPNALATHYLHLATERFGPGGRFVDKSLNSSRYMGLLASMLPDAPIIWMRRNPLDCAWSAYRTYFMMGIDWSWNLAHIAQHFKLEDRLHDYWTSVLGKRILTIDYEQLVADPEPLIRQIADHCSLEIEADMFTPHLLKRAVTTASVMQVRNPINTSAVNASDAYLDYLKPFKDGYFDNKFS